LIAVFFKVFSTSQTYTPSSRLPDASLFPLGENASDVIRPVWNVHFDETRVFVSSVGIGVGAL
jgi:hypothetical protein